MSCLSFSKFVSIYIYYNPVPKNRVSIYMYVPIFKHVFPLLFCAENGFLKVPQKVWQLLHTSYMSPRKSTLYGGEGAWSVLRKFAQRALDRLPNGH